MLHIWQKNVPQKYILVWSVGFLFGSLGWLINLIPVSLFASEALFWLLDTMVTMISASTVCYGFVLRANRSLHIVWFVVAAFVALNVMVYYSSVQNSVELKMAVSPFFVMLCLQISSLVLWFKPKPLSPAEKVVAVIFQIGALVHLARGILTAIQAQNPDQSLQHYYELVSFLLLPAAYTAIGIGILLTIISDLSEHNNELSITDSLTGTLNQNGIEQIAAKLMAHCQRSDQWISLILTNVDNLQSINEQYGHHAGDMVLRTFANTLTTNLRTGDYIGRVGGEEFLLLMPNTSDDGALQMAERLRLATGQICLTEREQEIRFTASFGVVSSRHEYFYSKLLSRAEHALYQANLSGRNRVVTPDLY